MHPLSEPILRGDRRALARGLSIVEDRREGYLELLKDLYRKGGKARIVGVTGPPGAGKSTLVNRLIGAYREGGHEVAVAAVDPSSAFSGGAILGDRVRMQDRALDPGVFIRSMATRGHMGGLSRATADALVVLDAAGFDVILVETVGVGQDEVDIVREADTVLVLLEIADVFVINKADREGVDRVERELKAALQLAGEGAGWTPPIVKTVASRGEGTEEVVKAVAAHEAHLRESRGNGRLKLKYRQRFWELLSERLLTEIRKRWLDGEREERLLRAFVERKADPYSSVEEILPRIRWEERP